MKTLRALALLALLAPAAGAVEVSLEENKVAKGSVGYVDMRLLFKLFPETQKAKASFEDSMRQAEEQINLRRAELIGLRAEISRLRAERDVTEKTAAAPVVGINLPGVEIVRSTAAAPGVSSSTSTAAAIPPLSARVAELDRAVSDKARLLSAKEADFKAFEAQAEKSLLDLESRKTEVLLGRIYAAIQETAKSENVSVVVDKSQILFGHKGVDLTDKVVQKLKSQSP